MPRLARSALPDGFVHVTVRGIRRTKIVNVVRDAQKLVELIASVDELWTMHARCVMPNHFHLVVDVKIEALSRAMQRVNGVYTQWFNSKYDLSGHLFESRYRAKPIADEAHLYEAVVYVLMNPVRAGLCRHPREWPWCNYAEVAENARMRDAIDKAVTALSRAGGDSPLRGQSPATAGG